MNIVERLFKSPVVFSVCDFECAVYWDTFASLELPGRMRKWEGQTSVVGWERGPSR